MRSRNLQLGLMFATALSFSMLPSAGRAYTPEQQQACSDDAFRLCSADIPDVDRVTVCMVRDKSQLSPRCRVYFGPDPEEAAAAKPATPRKPAKPASTKPAKPKKPAKPDAT